jgi:ectoine hydroxylase
MRLTCDQISDYHQDGFLILPSLFSRQEVACLRAEIPRVFGEDTPRRVLEKSGAVRSVFASHISNDVFRHLSRLPRLVEPAMQLLESDVYIHQFKINAKVALEGDVWQWHQDYLFWQKEDGMPTPRVLSAAVFLDTIDACSGPLLLIPGSHRETVDLEAGEGMNGWASTLTANLKYMIGKERLARLLGKSRISMATGEAGICVFFHGNTFHASATNLSAHDRTSIFVTYNSIENTLLPIPNPRPTFLAARDFTPLRPDTSSGNFPGI